MIITGGGTAFVRRVLGGRVTIHPFYCSSNFSYGLLARHIFFSAKVKISRAQTEAVGQVANT